MGEDGGQAGWITYEIEHDVVVASLVGDYSQEQVREFLLAARHDARLPGPRGLLMDARLAAVNPSISEIRGSIGAISGIRDGFRFPVHIVVASKLHYGLGRMVVALAGLIDLEVALHLDISDARAQLGLADEGSGTRP